MIVNNGKLSQSKLNIYKTLFLVEYDFEFEKRIHHIVQKKFFLFE